MRTWKHNLSVNELIALFFKSVKKTISKVNYEMRITLITQGFQMLFPISQLNNKKVLFNSFSGFKLRYGLLWWPRNIKKGDAIDNRMDILNHQAKVPKSKLSSGSLTGKYPISLDGGRTIIFISDKSKESETRKNYELRKDNRVNHYVKKPKT